MLQGQSQIAKGEPVATLAEAVPPHDTGALPQSLSTRRAPYLDPANTNRARTMATNVSPICRLPALSRRCWACVPAQPASTREIIPKNRLDRFNLSRQFTCCILLFCPGIMTRGSLSLPYKPYPFHYMPSPRNLEYPRSTPRPIEVTSRGACRGSP